MLHKLLRFLSLRSQFKYYLHGVSIEKKPSIEEMIEMQCVKVKKFSSTSEDNLPGQKQENAAVRRRLFHKPLKSTKDTGPLAWVVLPAI